MNGTWPPVIDRMNDLNELIDSAAVLKKSSLDTAYNKFRYIDGIVDDRDSPCNTYTRGLKAIIKYMKQRVKRAHFSFSLIDSSKIEITNGINACFSIRFKNSMINGITRSITAKMVGNTMNNQGRNLDSETLMVYRNMLINSCLFASYSLPRQLIILITYMYLCDSENAPPKYMYRIEYLKKLIKSDYNILGWLEVEEGNSNELNNLLIEHIHFAEWADDKLLPVAGPLCDTLHNGSRNISYNEIKQFYRKSISTVENGIKAIIIDMKKYQRLPLVQD